MNRPQRQARMLDPGSASSTELVRYLQACHKYYPQMDVQMARREAEAACRYYRSGKGQRGEMRAMQALEQRWYDSLRQGRPDYSVYADVSFLSDLWACWAVYSRGYLVSLRHPRGLGARGSVAASLRRVGRIADLGCGAGYTTAGLRELWPRADVVGTNLPGTPQYAMAARLGTLRGFVVADRPVGAFDLVFASEYFEHFERPLDHLYYVAAVTSARYMVVANSFGARSIGHFPEYLDEAGKSVQNHAMGRKFNAALRGLGYVRIQTKFWNQRPAVYEYKR